MRPSKRHRFRVSPVILALAVGIPVIASQGAATPDGPSAASLSATSAPAPRLPSNVCKKPSSKLIVSPAGKGRRIALSFDDGPSRYTPTVLRILKHNRVHATFFVTGNHVTQYPAYVEQVVAAGHQVGNHTWDHPQALKWSVPYGSFDKLPAATEVSEIDTTTQAIVDATGVRPCVFRAPGGHGYGSMKLVAQHGMSTVGWNQSAGDSSQPKVTSRATENRLVAAATARPSSGVVLLTHEGKASSEPERVLSSNRGNSMAALPRIIRWYKSHGYRFVRADGTAFGNRW